MNTAGSVFAAIGAVLLALLLVVGLAIGGRELNWWLVKDNTNRQTEINDLSYSRQTALKDQVMNDAKEIARIDSNIAFASPEYKLSLEGQRKVIVADMCDAAGSLAGTVTLSVSAQQFVNQECV